MRKRPIGSTSPLAAALILSAGCGTPDTPPESLTARLGTEFALAVGSTAHLDDNRLAILVDKVSDDSRCPPDRECVWPGDATVTLRVTADGMPSEQTLHTYKDPRGATVTGYRIQLRGLTPAKHGDIPQDRYRARLLTTRESDRPGAK